MSNDPLTLTPPFSQKSPWALPVPRLSLDPQFGIPPFSVAPSGPSVLQLISPPLRDRIVQYLDGIRSRLNYMSLEDAVDEVKVFVAGAAQVGDQDLNTIIANYCFTHDILAPFFNRPSPAVTPSQSSTGRTSDSDLVDAVKKALSSVIDGIPVLTQVPADPSQPNASVKIGVSGLTAELKKGSMAASAAISWSGTFSLDASRGDWHVSGSLSPDRWEFKISFPEDTAPPDLTQVGQVFAQGENALRGVIRATQGISNVKDIPKVAGNIKPYVQPLKDAVEAAEGIAKAPRGRFSFGFSLNSPTPMPGQQGIPRGVVGQATFTIVF